MVCIYKIISPTGKVYIGQTINFKNRSKRYKCLDCKDQVKIYRSLLKYGVESHKFEIIECKREELNTLEELYKKKFIEEFGWEKALFCQLKDREGSIKSAETKLRISKAKKGIKFTQEWKNKISKAKIGFQYTEEAKKRISEAKKGKKQSKEHITKRFENRRK